MFNFPSFGLGNEILSSSSILTTLPTAERRIRTPDHGQVLTNGPENGPEALPNARSRRSPLNTAWSCSKNRSLKCHAMVYLSASVLNHITMPLTTSLRRSLPSLAL